MIGKEPPSQWAVERARQLAQAEASIDIGDAQNLLGLSCYTMALARMIEQHEQPPLTIEQRAEQVIEGGLAMVYDDQRDMYWKGTAHYARQILLALDAAGITFAEKTND